MWSQYSAEVRGNYPYDPTLYGAAMAALKQAEVKRSELKSAFLRKRPLAYYAAPILLGLLPERTPDNKTRYSVMNLREALKMFSVDKA